jgi:hypothetical protein
MSLRHTLLPILLILVTFVPGAEAADTGWIEQSNRYSQWLLDANAR